MLPVSNHSELRVLLSASDSGLVAANGSKWSLDIVARANVNWSVKSIANLSLVVGMVPVGLRDGVSKHHIEKLTMVQNDIHRTQWPSTCRANCRQRE